ncbi:pirin family protein [Acetobacter vaccinii]|uniref:Pirin family protein n=1 Tax=Acetobacter vaccinii TaxID=2592655 RepID=A0A5C1YM48_9PROT|nr:pirin family protein [Acetobacter vaccinii]QEO17376.1 pirin family protein [Acetobacter vaccinii]
MITLRPFTALGHADHGWLDARHHFSFADYYDPAHVHWGALRVWNDDTIAPGKGFGAHPHKDMEIITYVRDGAITHQDSMGNIGRTLAGDVQVMSAGTGIVHSEFNKESDTTRIFQIWLLPDRRGHAPSWGTHAFPGADRAGQFVTLASGFEADTDALRIHSNSRVVGATLKKGQTVEYPLGAQRLGYLVPAKGAVLIEGQRVGERDGAALSQTEILSVHALEDSEIVLVDTLPV